MIIRNNTAEHCVEQYFKAWKKQDAKRAFNLCQITWQSTNAIKGRDWLKNIFGNWQVVEFEILKVDKPFKNEVVADVTIRMKCKYSNEKRILVEEKTVKTICRVIKEKVAYSADIKGKWGVNPISILKTEDDNG